jgi:hypothetical protein
MPSTRTGARTGTGADAGGPGDAGDAAVPADTGDPNAGGGDNPVPPGRGNPAPPSGPPGGANAGNPPAHGGVPARAGGAGAPAGSPAAGGGAAVVPGFALNPGSALGNTILDCLNNKANKWMYEQTIKSLYADPKYRLDLLSTTIQTFLIKISVRLQMVGNLILMIFGRNLCHCHAEYSLSQMRTRASTFAGTHTREAQDNSTFASMLWNSISDAATVML